jgi:hypothetical protein
MFAKYFSHDEPLLPPDVEICQSAFDEICQLQAIDRESDKARDVAALIIKLYRQGVHEGAALRRLVGVAGEP